jgi:DnaK suppressor protein
MSNTARPTQHPELDASFVERQRARLEALRDELLGGEQRVIAEQRADRELHGNEAREFEDEAQSMAQREVEQATRNLNDRRIGDIERALQKIGQGSYGLSDASGKPIPRARLESTPEAIYTIEEERAREAGA